jgi:hypothetical protein
MLMLIYLSWELGSYHDVLRRNRCSFNILLFPSNGFSNRAAELLQIDEAYFRHREPKENHFLPEKNGPITEHLQLVHYDVGQQYTP